jgi:hypothetical protein
MHSGRAALVLLPLGTFIACLSLGLSQTAPAGPEQPVPFSHKWHAGNLKLECRKCHANPDPGEVMGIAKPAVCLECHGTVKADSPHIQKLAAAGKEERELRWVRIYRIPEWVSFSHRAHLEKNNKCEECHGQVVLRDRLFREGDMTMGGCVECHKEKKASVDCTFCHEPR